MRKQKRQSRSIIIWLVVGQFVLCAVTATTALAAEGDLLNLQGEGFVGDGSGRSGQGATVEKKATGQMPSLQTTVIRTALSLLAVVATILALSFVTRKLRRWSPTTPSSAAAQLGRLHIIERVSVGPKKELLVVQFGETVTLIAASAENLSLITQAPIVNPKSEAVDAISDRKASSDRSGASYFEMEKRIREKQEQKSFEKILDTRMEDKDEPRKFN